MWIFDDLLSLVFYDSEMNIYCILTIKQYGLWEIVVDIFLFFQTFYRPHI